MDSLADKFSQEWGDRNYGIDTLKSGPVEQKPAMLEEMFLKPQAYKGTSEAPVWGLINADTLGKNTFSDRSADDFTYWRTRRHEAEHGLQASNPMSTPEYADQWRNNTGVGYADFLGKFNNRTKQIKASYPELQQFGNFDRVNLSPQGFKEALASLSEHEWAMKQKDPRYDITTDPAFEGVWDKRSIAAFKAMSGLRNTITDPKDIPPATVDTGGSWYHR